MTAFIGLHRFVRRGGFLFLVVLFLAALACGGEEEQVSWAVEKEARKGPVEVRVRASADAMTIADMLTLELEVLSDEGVEVEMPRFGDKLEQFGIVDYEAPPPALAEENRIRTVRSYTLEPFLSGEYTVPAMAVRFTAGGEETVHDLETEPFTVSVASLLPEDVESYEIKDIEDPAEIPPLLGKVLLWGGAGAAVLLAVLGFFWWLHGRKTRQEIARRLRAHEIAYGELERLLALDLVEKGEIKAFYNGVSGILRRYIENRFSLRAPERTTEEFLRELEGTRFFEASWKGILGRFLAHCDLVKFAEHRPDTNDIQETFDTCKEFIEATREDARQKGAGKEGDP